MDHVGVRWRSQTKQAVMCFMLMALLGEKNDIKHTQDAEEEQTTYCVESKSALEGPVGLSDFSIHQWFERFKICSSTALVETHLLIRLRGLQIKSLCLLVSLPVTM